MLDSRRELLDQIRLGESSFLELKEVRFRKEQVTGPRASNFADELAAFANSHGGVCVLGVSDRPREIVGIPLHLLDSVVGFVRHVCTELVEPTLDPIVDRLWLPSTTGEELAVVKVEVRRSLFVHRSPAGYLHRVADEKRAMSPDYLARLFQQRSQTRMIRFDEQVVSDATIDVLAPDLWERFRTQRTRDEGNDLLSKLRMARQDEDGVLRPTVAGVLMAARDARRWLPNAFVQAVAYRGDRVRPKGEEEVYQLDAADISGPLDRQVDEACRFVAKNMKVAAFKQLGRVDRPQFDMTAVFEAVVNAVAHRDYSIHGSKIRLRLFTDRLELYSPGEIPNTLEPENLLHIQSSRNEVLSSLLAKCPVPSELPWLTTDRRTLMDKRGEGMRIIVENSLELSGRTPDYRMIGGSEFLVTIYAPQEDSQAQK
ncbi:MAG: putative DNA binding domain-containing protein [Gemmatimonadetes bacterium]|nr:putative DNA binding domain-containing protein [Gemmatimonadota bacterium]